MLRVVECCCLKPIDRAKEQFKEAIWPPQLWAIAPPAAKIEADVGSVTLCHK
ncbi:hypothetical protein [Limnospira fusiformis]|uniref:hypothetical protein n=1 Tax=Limnospira fusiformis TaxID=54297 RepID=UPI0014496386|nr:hypothetical protein HFV01_29710 [Limnospira fusiformis SAG 85.79]